MNSLQIRSTSIRSQIGILPLLKKLNVELSRGEGTQQIHCLFHDDHRPSARVYTDTNKIFCYTCGKVWDVIGVVMGKKSISYQQAIEWIESNFNLAPASENLTLTIQTILKGQQPKKTTFLELSSMVESKVIECKDKLGLERYVKLLFALDLAKYQFTQNQLSYEQVQEFYFTVLRRCDSLT